jgi:hypothetical protein
VEGGGERRVPMSEPFLDLSAELHSFSEAELGAHHPTVGVRVG